MVVGFYSNKYNLWPKMKLGIKSAAFGDFHIYVNPNDRKQLLNFIKAYKNS